MPECRYCGAEFDDEASLNNHLLDLHHGELGPIDRRRLTGGGDGDGRFDVGTIALVGVVLIPLLLVAWLIYPSGGGSMSGGMITPHSVNSVHYHGTITVVVDGEQMNLADRPEYVNPLQHRAFHFDGVGDSRWHVHAQRVTLEYAMSTFDIDVESDQVTFEGTTYGDDEGETARLLVNGESVDAASYVLQQGDQIRLVLDQ